MDIHSLNDMKGGWFVGRFLPSAYSADFEVGIHRHSAGEYHQDHFHKRGTEINCVLHGRIKINGTEFGPNDIFTLHPYEVSIVEYLTDVELVVVRNLSDTEDKYSVDITD
jgi:hypothetical protein|tara:strand:+ start:804 stop:1133 length:330 start_codon:yes stop_codon:yes gene_type:complete